jgi:HPt (histidine-containing phosphotransfer) domain-containing protein
MRWLVVTNSRGHFVGGAEVEDRALVGTVAALLQVIPDAGIYVDGQLLTEETRAAMRAAIREAEASAATSMPEPAQLREYNETLKQSFGDVREGYMAMLKDMQEWARRSGEMMLERERQFADEAARQRKLTSQSLADVDLLGRSVKAVQFQEMFAVAGASKAGRSPREHSPSVMDLIGGFMRAVAGQR